MEAKVIVESFIEGRRVFKIGDILPIENESVYHNGEWICDIGSDFFDKHFTVVQNS